MARAGVPRADGSVRTTREDALDLAMKLALAENVQYVHGRMTCDEAGRPLFAYVCEYHQGYRDGLERIENRYQQVGLLIDRGEFIPQDIVEAHLPFMAPPDVTVEAVYVKDDDDD